MHPNTEAVSGHIRSARGDDRIRALLNAYTGQAGVVVTCGPSLAGYDPVALRRVLRGKVVFAVKQAIEVVGDEADFLCFNSYNVSRYKASSRHTIGVFGDEPSGKLPQLNAFDLRLPLERHSGQLSESLVVRQNFDDYLLSDHRTRPWGPGILHEMVFYLAIHLGLSELTTVGWDIANARGNNVHFYDSSDRTSFFDRGRSEAYSMVPVRRALPMPVRSALRLLRAGMVHSRGGVYNRTTMISGESEVVAASTAATSVWMSSHGLSLRVAGESSLVDQSVLRISPEGFLSHGRPST